MELLNEHFGEIIVGLVLAVFGWGFSSWSTTLSKSTKDILQSLSAFSKDYQNHKIEAERRMTRLEVELAELKRRVSKAGNGEID